MRRSTAHAIAAISMLPVAAIGSEDTLTEEIVVTASFTGATDSLMKPVQVLSGEGLANAGVQSLGEHIDSLVGVATADFGAVAGQPIIRGLSGTRVKVLNNGTVIRDVSGLGPDHAIDASLSDLQQIEVVRGPSALMYSNGSLGGIVNVVDNTIPMTDLEGFSGFLGGEAQSVNDGEAWDFAARGRVGGLNITYSFQDQDLENYKIPDNAVLGMHDEHEGEDHEGEHDEDHDHDEQHDEHGAIDELANSDFESSAHRLGLSTTGDWGYVGVSYTDLSTTYGIPFHGEHGDHEDHGAHDDDHGDHHDGDHEDDYDLAHEGEEHGEERIYAETESETVTFRGSLNTSFGWLNSVDFVLKDTDYELSEGHMEVGHDEHEGEEHDDHDEHGPTVFSNESTEIQIALDLSAGERVRRLVFNYAEEEMSIIGEEAFMAPVDSTETTLGFFSSDDLGFANLDLGVRFDRIERDGFLSEMHHDEDHDEHEGEHDEDHDEHDEDHHDDHHEGEMTFEPQSYKEDAFSIAAMLSRELNEYSTVSLGLSSVSKIPSAVELFMNGEHLATARYEVGDVTLDTERADSIDLTFSFERNGWYGMASVYHNRIDNYIYLRDELEEEHEAHMDEDHHDEEHHDEEHHDEEHADHGGLMLAEYMQRDAEFSGYEIEIGKVIELPRGALQLSLARDEVNAEFTNGEDVPRIVPARNIFSAQYTLDNFSARLLVKDVEEQNSVAPGESVTDGFTCIDAFASWSYGLNDSSRLTLSAFARNLTDEVSRNHASFVKDDVPLPGRNIGVRVQLNF
jgi:iron complex outermembrane receptor protein